MPSLRLAVPTALLLALAACDSAEERAEGHYQDAVALIEAGDVERGLVELRNVFRLEPAHREARRLYGDTVLAQGQTAGAYRQYLQLVEDHPGDVEARLTLADLAVATGSWEEAERHGRLAIEAAPEDPRARAVSAVLDYRTAIEAEDAPARREAARAAADLLEAQPETLILAQVVLDNAMRDGDFDAALAAADAAIAIAPDNRDLYTQRLIVLRQMGDGAAVEAQLREMIDLFPDEPSIRATLIGYYVSQGRTDDAEAFMRDTLDPAAEDPERHVELVRFLLETRGRGPALDEIDRALQTSPNADLFRSLRAGIRFDAGARRDAIAEMEEILEAVQPSDQTNRIRVALARMLSETGNEVGARAQVAEVLEADPTMVEALKMEARFLVEGDQAEDAILRLRTALDQAPQDAEAMSLMADAHLRQGNRDLARDMMALAVEASGAAPGPSIRYARELASEDRWRPAEDVLIEALRAQPGDVSLLAELGRVYVGMEDWGRAEQAIETLRREAESDAATRAADALEVAVLGARGRADEAVAALEGMAEDGGAAAQAAVVQARLAAGDNEGALAYAEDALAENPENPALRFIQAAVRAATGDVAAAEAEYRALTRDEPGAVRVWLQLSRLLAAEGRAEDARAVIEEALVQNPRAPDLLWAEAGYREAAGDIDGAIAIYEDLYAQNSGALVVANNLASLISTHREDAESLERAWTIARRLRGTEVPAFADTYGWIALRRGETEEALPYLERAAEGLPTDPLVHYHLAEALSAAGREAAALASYRRAVEVAEDDDARPQIAAARTQVAALEASGVEPPANGEAGVEPPASGETGAEAPADTE